jgi:hypothetical protein
VRALIVEPDLPLFRVETMEQSLARQRWQSGVRIDVRDFANRSDLVVRRSAR